MPELHKNRFANEHEVHSEKRILNKKNSNHYVTYFSDFKAMVIWLQAQMGKNISLANNQIVCPCPVSLNI